MVADVSTDLPLIHLGIALGLGLLIGVERERRKLERGSGSPMGVRTFSIAALAGAASVALGGVPLLAVVTAVAGVLAVAAYWTTRDADDPGMTTETALVLTVVVGGLAMRDAELAAAVGVALALLLAARTPLHNFVGAVLTDREVSDGMVLAGATLIILPLLPDSRFGPYGALNLHRIWIVVILVMAIGAAGHIAVRWLGPRYGLAVAGLASGFISSSATIGAMGARARKTPTLLSAAVAGAVLSTVATVAQMAIVVGAVSPPTLRAIAPPLIGGGAAALLYGVISTLRALRQPYEESESSERAFSLAAALIFALVLSLVLLLAAALRDWLGETGVLAAAAMAGLADAHAAAISVASLAASGSILPAEAVVPILAGLSTNTVTKLVLATTSRAPAFAVRVVPGLILVAAAAWAAMYVPSLF
jgi:uncharacterized membrane protein (DUF4010 family)